MKRILTVAVVALALAGLATSAAHANALVVKNNNVAINHTNPANRLHMVETLNGANFRFDTRGTATESDWYFQVNAVTGAFLLSNFFGGLSQFQVFPNNAAAPGGPFANPPNTLVIRDGGVGIGTQSPGLNKFNVAAGKATEADAWTVRSSIRFKENVQPLENALDTIGQLRGVSYNLKATGKAEIGLIAEEVGEVLPQLVSYEANGVDAQTLDYDKLTALLIEAVKAQQAQIDDLKARLAE